MKQKNVKKKRICFCASSGGHFEQIMMLKPLIEKYDSIIITEKSDFNINIKDTKIYYVPQTDRTNKTFIFKFIFIFFKSLYILIKHRPNVTISTGALVTFPMLLLTKIFGGKVIFIESFAKISSPTLTGKLAYKFADEFYVQWEDMKKYYPNAIYKGGIY